MFRLALGTLRFRTAGFVASFVVVVLGATMVIAAGGLLESGIRATVPPQRLTAPPISTATRRCPSVPASTRTTSRGSNRCRE
jgi:putative ABC transport system permease protein